MKRHLAFTLIELLVVVAIIAILAAIAVPNFMEAQVRSKVSRVHSDMRSIGVGIEAYRVDENKYPPIYTKDGYINWTARLNPLTTPVAYVTGGGMFRDVFNNDVTKSENNGAHYNTDLIFLYRDKGSLLEWSQQAEVARSYGNPASFLYGKSWFLQSWGPDQDYDAEYMVDYMYDGTNGTRSSGDIHRSGP